MGEDESGPGEVEEEKVEGCGGGGESGDDQEG